MPFYEYQCRNCGHHHEALQRLSDAPLKKCPECGRNTLKRLMSAPVFRLKGGGWYETDFKSEAEGKRNIHGEADDKPGKVDGAPEPAKAEAKVDAKADAKVDAKIEAKGDAKGDAKAEARPAESKSVSPAPKASRRGKPPGRKPAARSKAVARKPARRKR